ncbi:MAG TPA: nicotinate (nicotinamide) nucleotide adenylyltransferase [Terriglobales bacterium]|nr:nicotinate (nicotinamide) nucleotide adenylyltransferase [Terriglobales bacterium]
MNIGLFGGTFDPIHNGHLALARAAKERCSLRRIYFVPANVPPHKQMQPLSSYFDRYAMVVLATLGEKAFLPSLLEAPNSEALAPPPKKGSSGNRVSGANYSIDTVHRLKDTLEKSDRLFFLIGIDAFRDIASWRDPEGLLGECAFIVASRPGYSLADVANALPEGLRPKASVTKPFSKQPARGELVLPGVTIHLLENVQHNVSATAIREAAAHERRLTKFVSPAVAEYIQKRNLYKGG